VVSINYADAARLIRKGRRAELRGAAAKGCIGGLVVGALNTLLKGWLLMLAVAVMHDHWVPALPTIGYWWAVLVMCLLPSLGATPSTKDKP
jgi:hypothetical protein